MGRCLRRIFQEYGAGRCGFGETDAYSSGGINIVPRFYAMRDLTPTVVHSQ